MRIKLFILLVLSGNIVTGQTDKHKPIPGTKCSLIPPAGFIAATNFSGFQHTESGASIMVTEIPAPVQTITESFTAEGLKSKGMTLIDKQSIDFNNSKAILVKVSQPANGTTYLKQILIFGDAGNTVMVNGIYPIASKAIEPDMKTALLSTSYNAAQSDNPLDAVKFSIDVNGTEFKFTKYISGSLLYTTDGKIPTQGQTFIVGNALSKVETENQRQFATDRLKKLPRGETKIIKETNPVSINDLKGFEIVAEGKSPDGKDELTYQVMLFSGNGEYYLMVGNAAADLKNNLEVFRKIAKTFKRK